MPVISIVIPSSARRWRLFPLIQVTGILTYN